MPLKIASWANLLGETPAHYVRQPFILMITTDEVERVMPLADLDCGYVHINREVAMIW